VDFSLICRGERTAGLVNLSCRENKGLQFHAPKKGGGRRFTNEKESTSFEGGRQAIKDTRGGPFFLRKKPSQVGGETPVFSFLNERKPVQVQGKKEWYVNFYLLRGGTFA